MGRYLLRLILICIGFLPCLTMASPEYYLNQSEKAIVALVLKSVLAEPVERVNLIKKTYARLRDSSNQAQQKIKISSYNELLLAQQNTALFANYKVQDLNTEVLLNEIKSVTYYSDTYSVQKKIDDYFEKRSEVLRGSALLVGLAGFDIALQSQSTNQELADYVVNYIDTKINDFVNKLNESKNPQVLVISKLLKAYFKNLPEKQKIEIVYQLSQIPINSNSMDVFLVMIQNSGPQIQKLIQIMGRSSVIPAEFQNVFQKLESQVNPVPWREVRALVESEGVEINDFIYFERTPIGVGTMAQAHRVQFIDEKGQRQSSVIRFLKPKIAELIKMDYDILKVIANDIDNDPELKKFNLPSLADLVDDLNKSVVEELDLLRTITDQNKAQKIYKKFNYIKFNNQKNKLQFSVPKTYAIGKNKNLMVQELVFGQKPYKELKQYKDIYPDLYEVIAEKTAELWLTEAFFGSGFFHADLHQGNLLMQITDSEIKVNLLDFGMTGFLNSEMQKSALLLGLGIRLNHPQLIFKHITLLSKLQLAVPGLLKKIQERCDKIKLQQIKQQSLSEWITWALDQGLDLNYEFLKLNRGLTAIEVLLTDAKSKLTFTDIIQSLALQNKIYMAEIVVGEKDLKIKDYPDLLMFKKEVKSNQETKSCKELFKY